MCVCVCVCVCVSLCAKLISSSKTIFYKEVENIKQALINNRFPNYIFDEQIKRMIKNVNKQNKHCHSTQSTNIYQTFLPQPNALQLWI